MSDDNKWIISSSGRYMFVILSNAEFLLPTRFLAKIHNGNHILYWTLVQKVNLLTKIVVDVDILNCLLDRLKILILTSDV